MYSFDVGEDWVRGSRVGTVEAADPDEGENGLLSYSVISDWANDVFSLNPQTGVFTLTTRLDYEEVSSLILFYFNDESRILLFLKRVYLFSNIPCLLYNTVIYSSFANLAI